jgi:hypothetical protein
MAYPGIRLRMARRSTTTTLLLLTIATSVWLPGSMAGHASSGTNDERSGQSSEVARARPLALASADFDADGVPDLLAGYATGSGGLITLHRGNVDAIYPNAPKARARRLSGQFTSSPFLPGARTFAVPAASDFLHTGDFDADGHFDAIAAAAGGAAVVLRGDGTGLLGPAEPIALPGVVTAMTVGDINGPDGLADVALGVTADSGSRLLVFAGHDGAWTSTPAVIDLPAPATAVALGLLDDEHVSDIAVAAGKELLIAHGRERRPRASRTATTAAAPIERQTLPFAIQSMTAGDFTGDRRPDLAVAAADGAVHVLTRQADTIASGMGRAAEGSWSSVITMDGVGTGATRILPARVRNRPADDLIAINQSSGRVQVLGGTNRGLSDAGVAAAAAVLPMRLDADARDDLVILRAGEVTPIVQTTLAAAASHVVVNTNDSGEGSLRQAILNANATPGDDLITFDIPGPGPHTIALEASLPPLLPETAETGGAIIIDGTREPDYAGTPVVELSGALVLDGGNGLTIASAGCVVRGLVINRFATGILFTAQFRGPADGGFIEGNYIGTDVTGAADLGNDVGVQLGTATLTDSTSGNTVGGTAPTARNVISGNESGIVIFAGPHVIQGNFIGTDVSGSIALGNASSGLTLFSSHSTQLGGPAPGARNIVSANGDDGVILFETGPMLISHNYIGTDVSGSHALGNGGEGVHASDSGATIVENLIAANARNGILASGAFAGVDILANRIGTNSTGTAALGNGASGIDTIGFNQVTRGNLVSGNAAHGMLMRGTGNLIQANLIGADISGTVPLGNQGDGVQLGDPGQTVGGDGNDNVIAFNGGGGVVIPMPFTVPILSNAIFSNGGLGIDIGDDGPTPNDLCDTDQEVFEGPLNRPVLTGVTSSSSGTTITGQLNSVPNSSFLLQLFSSADPDPSGFGEGASLLGSTMVATDGTCNASFSITLPVALTANHVVTSTATITNEFGPSATSEFSNALRFVPQTSEDAIRALIAQVRDLVAQGELNGLAGFVLTIKLQVALFFVERDLPRVAAVQIRGFIQIVELLVRVRQLEPSQGQALVEAAQAILAGLETS